MTTSDSAQMSARHIMAAFADGSLTPSVFLEACLDRTSALNPAINALYCTLLHAAGAPRDAFNAGAAGEELCGPLKELVA